MPFKQVVDGEVMGVSANHKFDDEWVEIDREEYVTLSREMDIKTFGMDTNDPEWCWCCMGKCKDPDDEQG